MLQNKPVGSKIFDLAPGNFDDFQGGRTKACLVQGEDDNTEKQQNCQRKACCTLYTNARLDKNLRFDELAKALRKIGYIQSQPKGGSSHYTFRKKGCTPITLAKTNGMHMDIVYIRLVKDVVDSFLADGGDENG